jgi:hypothetical protein
LGALAELSTRPTTPEDAAAIAATYNEGIADRIATFEISRPPTGTGTGVERALSSLLTKLPLSLIIHVL